MKYKEALEEFKRAYLLRVLQENEWNISATARACGVDRTQIHRMAKAADIILPGCRPLCPRCQVAT